MTRRRFWAAIIALAGAAVFLASIGHADLAQGTRAPGFTLPTIDDKSFTLADCFKKPGKVVVLDIWATWCPPCRASIPHLVALDKKFKDREVQFVGVAIDKARDKGSVIDFARQRKIGYTIALDPEARKVGEPYGLATIPTMYLIDRNGMVRYVHTMFPVDPRSGRDDPGRIEKEIEALLARK